MVFVINSLRGFTWACLASVALLSAAEKASPQKTPPVAARTGIRTPGIQIPFSRLKAEQEFVVAGGARWLAVTGQVVIAPGKAEGSVARLDARGNKTGEAVGGVGQACAAMVKSNG